MCSTRQVRWEAQQATADDGDGGQAALPGLRGIAALCYDSIKDEFGVSDNEIDRPQFDRLVGDFDAWTIAPDRITITFPRYSILGGVAPGGDCALPIEDIREHLRADNPLWGTR